MIKLLSKEHGVVSIIVALSMVVLIGIAALAVDVGYLYVVRNRVQNAADAAALAGADVLYRSSANPTNFMTYETQATTAASNAIPLNISAAYTDTINVNNWNKLTPAGPNNAPAVQVIITETAVGLFFAKIFGMTNQDVSATATAVVQSPSSFGAGSSYAPFVIDLCMYNNYWDSTNNKALPINDPNLVGTYGAYAFEIHSSYHSGSCQAGEWSPLMVSPHSCNSVPCVKAVTTSGNPDPMSIGSLLWLSPGTKTALYSSINTCSAAGNGKCQYTVIPIVNNLGAGYQTITGFSCIEILAAFGGSSKTVIAEMLPNPTVGGGNTTCTPNGTGNGSTNYGLTEPPLLGN